MTNKQLFKEAIAEAKSIREAAIINAKEALEESLTPQIKSLLAQRLAEMEEEDMEEEMLEAPVAEKKEEEAEEEEESAEKEEAEGESEDIDVADMSVDDLKDLIRDLIGQVVDQDGEQGMEEPSGDEEPADMMGAEDEEEIDLDELLAELSEEEPMEAKYAEEEPMEELTENIDPQTLEMIVAGLGALSTIGLGFAIDPLKRLLSRTKAGKQIVQGLEGAGSAAGAATRSGQAKGTFENTDLQEALKTIKSLRGNLQEVNLLNAKLLYVNKIFKSSKNLSESQKANIVTTFDKATSAKEAQLVYESLKTTLNSQKPSTSSTKITESRLGMASKPTGVTAKRPEIISEVSDAVKRMQKLAGIIK